MKTTAGMKGTTLRATWQEKREAAKESGRRLTRNCPAWLTPKDGPTGFIVHEERAGVIRRIFRLAREGHGPQAIADKLNAEGVPTFGRAGRWGRSYVDKLLRGRAVLGELVPHRGEYERAGQHRVRRPQPQKPVPGYYPAILESEMFEVVQARMAGIKETARKGSERNVLSGLARCFECRSLMTRVVSQRGEFLRCTKAKRNKCSNRDAIPLDDVESALCRHSHKLLPPKPSVGELPARHKELSRQLRDVLNRIDDLTAELENLEQMRTEIGRKLADVGHAIEVARGPEFSKTLHRAVKALGELDVHRRGNLRRVGPSVQTERIERKADGSTEVEFPIGAKVPKQERSEEGKGRDPDAVIKVNTTLREALLSVTIDSGNRQLLLTWRHDPDAESVVVPLLR